MLKNYVWRRLALAGLLAAGTGTTARAQVNNYTFAASAGTFVPLPATATPAGPVQNDEGVSAALPLGFTFVFDGTAYAQVRASSNGFLSFGPAVVAAPANSLAAGAAGLRPLVAPLWDNLSGNGARASYQTTGTAPNRVFTFEWKSWKWNNLAPAAGISFQVQLTEGSNTVAFVYQPEAGTLNAPTASAGLAGTGTGTGAYLSLLDTSPNPTASSTLENASLDTAPAAGQTYTFTPGAAVCSPPRALTVGNITGTSAALTFAGSAAAVGYVVTYTAAGGSPVTVAPNPTASPVTLTGLLPGTSYTASVASDCGGGNLTSAATATFGTASYCAANLGGGGCAATDLISAVSIAGTALNNTTNNCQTANGSSYSTFPAAGSTTATLASGAGSYTLSVTSTAASASGFWIDYDQNNAFDAAEFTRISAGGRPGQAATVAFAVPATAVQGLTKLRIRTRTVGGGGATVAATDACTTFTSGETEDYVVTIGAPAACPAPTGLAVRNVTATSASVAFTGTAASFTVTYTPQGGVPVTVVPAPTASPVALSGLAPSTTYAVSVVGNCTGGAASAAATATFSTLAVAPANDECVAAVALPVTPDCASPTAGTVAGATQSLAPTANCGPGGGLPNAFDVWYRFVATATSQVLTLAPAFNAVADVRGGACATTTSLSCAAVAAGAATSRLLTGLTVGTVYFVRVYPLALNAPTGPAAAFTLCLTDAPVLPANDECAAAIAVPVTADCSTPTAGTVAGATQSLAPTPNCGRNATAAPDVWYRFVATATTHLVEASAEFNGLVDVRSGPCATTASLACNTVAPGNPRTITVNALTVGSTYFVRFYPSAGTPVGASAALQLCVTTVPTVPANDEPCGALSLNTGNAVAATTAGATTTALPGINQPTCSGANAPRDVWFTVTAINAGLLLNLTGNSASVARLYTAATCSTAFALVDCRRSANGQALGLQAYTGLVAGRAYYLAVSGFANNSLTGAIAVDYIVLGTRAQLNTDALLVYPNPSSTGQLTLRLAAPATAGSATLLNVLGQAVATLPLPAHTPEATLAVRGLAAGTTPCAWWSMARC